MITRKRVAGTNRKYPHMTDFDQFDIVFMNSDKYKIKIQQISKPEVTFPNRKYTSQT